MSPKLPRFSLTSVLWFMAASAIGWGLLWALVFHLLGTFTVAGSSGEAFGIYFKDNFLSLFGMFCFGAFGAAIRMHFDAEYRAGYLVLDDGTDAFGRMSIGGFFGIMAFAALDAGLLSVLVTGTNVAPSITAQMVLSFGFGLYASEIFKKAGQRLVKRDDETDDAPEDQNTHQGGNR